MKKTVVKKAAGKPRKPKAGPLAIAIDGTFCFGPVVTECGKIALEVAPCYDEDKTIGVLAEKIGPAVLTIYFPSFTAARSFGRAVEAIEKYLERRTLPAWIKERP